MIARPLTRRAVVAGGLLGAATLTGCSTSELTRRRSEDPEAADRARLAKARDLSVQLHDEIASTMTQDPRLSPSLTKIRDLHIEQIAQFTSSAGLPNPRASASTSAPLSLKALTDRERALAQAFRTLALHAQRGDVAALLASAAAGIDQVMAR
ncbi:MAG: hypothetical protein ACTHJM_09210 [Marmoricola sp.]